MNVDLPVKNFKDTAFLQDKNLNKLRMALIHNQAKQNVIQSQVLCNDDFRIRLSFDQSPKTHKKQTQSFSIKRKNLFDSKKDSLKKILTDEDLSPKREENELHKIFASSPLRQRNHSMESTQNKINDRPRQTRVDVIYKKIFDKHLLYRLNPKFIQRSAVEDLKDDRNALMRKSYIESKIIEIKSKLFFMKGVFDYSYPPIILKRMENLDVTHRDVNTQSNFLSKEKMFCSSNSKTVDKLQRENNKKINVFLSSSIKIENCNSTVSVPGHKTFKSFDGKLLKTAFTKKQLRVNPLFNSK